MVAATAMDTAPTGTGTGTQVSLRDGNGEEGGWGADWVCGCRTTKRRVCCDFLRKKQENDLGCKLYGATVFTKISVFFNKKFHFKKKGENTAAPS